MTPRKLTDDIVRETPLLRADQRLDDAVAELLDSGLPALPVVDGGRLAGIFGEREFIAALFPAYIGELKYVGFVPKTLDEVVEKRQSCRADTVGQHMNTEHVDVGPDYSDVQIAETFLHHRVLIVPITDEGGVVGVITRSDFFHALAQMLLQRGG